MLSPNFTTANRKMLNRRYSETSALSIDNDDNFSRVSVMPSNSTLLITVICLVNLIANSAYSSIAPFFPNEAISKGVPESVLGLIFSSYSIAMFVFAPLFKVMLDKYGSKKTLILGLVSMGIAMIVFGVMDRI
jgi:MFS family permease